MDNRTNGEATPPIYAVTRRRVLRSLGAVAGAGALTTVLGPRALRAATPSAIDVHHHFMAPFLAAAEGRGRLNWDLQYSLDDMDKAGVAKAVLSPPTSAADRIPAGTLRDNVRRINDFGAKLVRDHPARFGQFAYMPLPDVDATLAEIAYGLDALKTDGVGFATSYGKQYLSDPSFTPVWEELHRRKAVAYVHPLAGACCDRLFPKFAQEERLIEIPYDTGRVVITLLLAGVFQRYPDIQWIFSHSGGPIPMFAGRIKRLTENEDLSAVAPNGIEAELRRLHYETGNANSPPTMAALLKFVPVSQVLFGSDHPYVPVAENMEDLQSCGLPPDQMRAILHDNAVRLMPRLMA